MKIDNPFQLNDWSIKKFLGTVLAIQVMVWLVTGLAAIGFGSPAIRPLVTLVYLLFIPGVIILRLLGLHRLGSIETLLYSVGLSLATVMFIGLVLNGVLPLLGVTRPISTIPFLTTISVLVLILSAVSCARDRGPAAPSHIDIEWLFSPWTLFLLLIPFLSIFGTYLVNLNGNNVLLMLLITVIVLTVLMISFGLIPKNLYPLAIFAIAVSLLLQRSLISMYISGTDIHLEYYQANLVITDGYWNPTSASLLNGMLPLTMLAPISSLVSGMSLTWVFKIIGPLLFSLAPLGLYQVFQKQTDDKIAFLSVFFLVSVFNFWNEMAVVLRQPIAVLFLVSLILLMIDKKMGTQRALLFIVFGASLVVSHYTISYIYMFWLIFAWLILASAENPKMRKLRNNFFAKFSRFKGEKLATNPISSKIERRTIGLDHVMLFIVFAFTWYMYVSGSGVFNTVVSAVSDIVSNAFTEFLNPAASQGLSMLLGQPNPGLLHLVNTIILYLTQVFIVVGVLALFFERKELKFEKDYTAFSILSLVILFAGILVPFFTISVNMERLYYIALIVLAPFCVIGGLTAFRVASRVGKVSWTNERARQWLKILSVYFVIFFLFQTGFVWEVTEGYSQSISLSQEGIKKYGTLEEKAMLYNALTPKQEVFSARWLSVNRNAKELIYAIFRDQWIHALNSYGMIPSESVGMTPSEGVLPLTRGTRTIPDDAYVYLQYVNVVEGIGTEFDPSLRHGREHSTYDMTEIFHLYEAKNKIYSNGGSEIYK
jgi:uncharacterized membrane protein